MNTDDRTRWLGSSDIPKMLGLSSWGTPLDLWLEKTGRGVAKIDEQRAKILRRGHRLEPIVLDTLEEEGVVKIAYRDRRHYDPQYPWMTAQIDAAGWKVEFVDVPVDIEVKTGHESTRRKWGEPGTDEIPIDIASQVLWAQMISGTPRTLIAVLLGSDDLRTYMLERDDSTISAIREKALKWWRDHVVADKPPEPKTQEDLSYLFRRDVSTRIEATAEIAEKAMRYIEVSAEIMQREAERARLKFDLGRYMLGAEAVDAPQKTPRHVLTVSGRPLLQVAYREADKLDVSRLARELPDIAAQYRRISSYFEYRRAKKE